MSNPIESFGERKFTDGNALASAKELPSDALFDSPDSLRVQLEAPIKKIETFFDKGINAEQLSAFNDSSSSVKSRLQESPESQKITGSIFDVVSETIMKLLGYIAMVLGTVGWVAIALGAVYAFLKFVLNVPLP